MKAKAKRQRTPAIVLVLRRELRMAAERGEIARAEGIVATRRLDEARKAAEYTATAHRAAMDELSLRFRRREAELGDTLAGHRAAETKHRNEAAALRADLMAGRDVSEQRERDLQRQINSLVDEVHAGLARRPWYRRAVASLASVFSS